MFLRKEITAIRRLSGPTLLILLLLLGALPVSGSWKEDFSDTELTEWELGAVDWSSASFDGRVNAIDHTWTIMNEQLVSQSDAFLTAHSHACRTFEGDLKQISFDILAPITFWGLYIGKNFDIFQNTTLDQISFEGIGIQNQVTNELIGHMTFKVHDFSGSMEQIPIRQEARTARGAEVLSGIDNWLSAEISFTEELIQFTTENHIGKSKSDVDNLSSNFDSFDTICLFSYFGGDIFWDNVDVRTRNLSFAISPLLVAIVIGVGLGIGGIAIHRRFKQKYIHNMQRRYLSKKVLQTASTDFTIPDDALLTLLSMKDDKEPGYINEMKNNIPVDLIDFKYLLHPTRLLILKMLHDEYKMSSYAIRQILDLSSGEFNSHRKSLAKKGYIEIETSISISRGRGQTLYITPQGNQQYEMVFNLLNDLVDKKTPYYYLLHAKKLIEDSDELYPKGS